MVRPTSRGAASAGVPMAAIAHRRLAVELAREDVVGQRRDVLATSLVIFLPSRGLMKRRRWLATLSQISTRGHISPAGPTAPGFPCALCLPSRGEIRKTRTHRAARTRTAIACCLTG